MYYLQFCLHYRLYLLLGEGFELSRCSAYFPRTLWRGQDDLPAVTLRERTSGYIEYVLPSILPALQTLFVASKGIKDFQV
jgi:hypothetical protein